MNMYDIFKQDNNILIYRPEFTKVTGSVTSAILLQQIIYRLQDAESFYKFKEPCKHALYKEGDSWIEELGFTRREFDTALEKLKGLKLVNTQTTMDRITYYSLNKDVFNLLFSELYLNDERGFTKSANAPTVKAESAFSKSTNTPLDISNNLLTENTSENTKERVSKDTTKKEIPELPNWLNLEAWNKWVQHRKEIKKPITPTAMKQQLKILEDNRYDQVEIIEQSINNGYQGLFPIKRYVQRGEKLTLPSEYEAQLQQKFINSIGAGATSSADYIEGEML